MNIFNKIKLRFSNQKIVHNFTDKGKYIEINTKVYLNDKLIQDLEEIYVNGINTISYSLIHENSKSNVQLAEYILNKN